MFKQRIQLVDFCSCIRRAYVISSITSVSEWHTAYSPASQSQKQYLDMSKTSFLIDFLSLYPSAFHTGALCLIQIIKIVNYVWEYYKWVHKDVENHQDYQIKMLRKQSIINNCKLNSLQLRHLLEANTLASQRYSGHTVVLHSDGAIFFVPPTPYK